MLELFFGFIALCLICLILWYMGHVGYKKMRSPFYHSVDEKIGFGFEIMVCIVFFLSISYLLGILIVKIF